MTTIRTLGSCLFLSVLAFVGCGESLSGRVTGIVTFDSKPLTTGGVAFHPASTGAVGVGQIGPDGKYKILTGTAEGLAPGEYTATVVVTAPAVIPQDGSAPKAPPLVTPAKYTDPFTSGLKFTVKPGSNDCPINLSSSP